MRRLSHSLCRSLCAAAALAQACADIPEDAREDEVSNAEHTPDAVEIEAYDQALQSIDRPLPRQVVVECYADCHDSCGYTQSCDVSCAKRCAPKGGWYQCRMQDNSGNRAICIVGNFAWWGSCHALCALVDSDGCHDACDYVRDTQICPEGTICV